MDKNIEISLLYDFYAELLKEQQQKAVSLYYNDDLSLSEIADRLNISRQGVRDLVKRGEERLYMYEEKLGLYKRFKKSEEGLLAIEELSQRLIEGYDKQLAQEILNIAESLHE